MKKLPVYLIILILSYFLQACNSHSSTDDGAANDSMINGVTYNEDTAKERPGEQKVKKENTRKKIAAKENIAKQDTAKKKNAVHIAATEVPFAVMNAFNNRHPNITHVKWATENKKGKTLYKAHWQFKGKKITDSFAEDGSFIKEKQPK